MKRICHESVGKKERKRERERAEVHGVHQGLQRVFQGRDN